MDLTGGSCHRTVTDLLDDRIISGDVLWDNSKHFIENPIQRQDLEKHLAETMAACYISDILMEPVAAEPSFVSILSRIDSVKLIISRLLFSPRRLEGLKMAKLRLQAIENMVQFKIDKLEEKIYGKN